MPFKFKAEPLAVNIPEVPPPTVIFPPTVKAAEPCVYVAPSETDRVVPSVRAAELVTVPVVTVKYPAIEDVPLIVSCEPELFSIIPVTREPKPPGTVTVPVLVPELVTVLETLTVAVVTVTPPATLPVVLF